MRVCFVSFEYPPNILGGAGTYAETLVKGLRRRGVDTFVISKGNQHDKDQRTFRVPTSNSLYWRRLFFIEPAMSLFHKLNSRYKFDLVHFNEPHVILEKPKLPTVCTLHSTQINEIKLKLVGRGTLKRVADIKDFILKGSMGSIFDILTAHAVDKIICPSGNLADLIRSYCLVDARKTLVIPNGIDLESFSNTKPEDVSACLKKYGLEESNYILFVGRLSVLKGAQFAIEAFKSIRMEHPNLKMAIVGKGDFENHLRDLARGIKNLVFTGYVSSLKIRKTLYENSLLVVVPSLYEALPMVVLEAMACGKAVVASNVGGIPLVVRNGESGFLAKPGDSKDLERLINILCEDSKLRESMGSFGRRLVEKEFSVDRMVDRTLKVYESLCWSDLKRDAG
jgi:glycosyltransferase involved in cell wall biosynthesis